ncbi:MAG: hypothetical protein ACLPH3_07890 [Terracidiphilus sp.]
MKRMFVLVTAVLLTLISTRIPAQENRVGTFNRQAIVLAYYRSPLWAATLKQKRSELGEAKRADDTNKVEELDAWFGKAQEMAHGQLWGNADIGNVLEALQPAFAEIEKSDHVSSVVVAPAHDAPARSVDVTERLLDWLKADETTRKMIRDLNQK